MSGKQSRRRRREALRTPQATKRSRHASPKALVAIAVALALAAVVVVLAATFGGGSSATPLAGVADTGSLLRGIPQAGNVLGAASAPVTIVEYADLQCPYCRDFELNAVPQLIGRYVRNGRAKLVFRPLAFIGPDSVRGRNAVIAAGRQNHLFEFVQLLYANQRTENTGWLDERIVRSIADAIPALDAGRLHRDRTSATVSVRASAFDAAARANAVDSTPTLLVGRTGGPLRRVEAADVLAAVGRIAG